jgi:hypothetical protein
MRLRSKGLGRKELVIDFREVAIVREGDEVAIKGTIREPVVWDFAIRVCEDDLAGVARLVADRRLLGLLLRGLLRREPRHHWAVERADQLARTGGRRAEAERRFGAPPPAPAAAEALGPERS